VHWPIGALAYTSLDQLTAWNGGDATNAVAVTLNDPATAATTASRLGQLPGVTATVNIRALQQAMTDTFSLYTTLVIIMTVIGAAMAAAIVYTTTSANITERRVELGTLRAAGCRPPGFTFSQLRMSQVLSRSPQVREAGLAPQRHLALTDADLDIPGGGGKGPYTFEDLDHALVTGEELLRCHSPHPAVTARWRATAVRNAAAVCSGSEVLIAIPVPSSKPAAMPSRGTICMCQLK
jgi:hypothetical protein